MYEEGNLQHKYVKTIFAEMSTQKRKKKRHKLEINIKIS